MKKIAIMQPYFLPYIGYFQIVAAVDLFVFYDDVNFIKGGWINRNKIIINNEPNFITVPLQNASSNKLIRDTYVKKNQRQFLLLEKKIEQRYKKAPYFNSVFPLVQNILKGDYMTISELSISSIKTISEYLCISTEFVISSEKFGDTKDYYRSERLAKICHKLSATNYINAIGGEHLYDKNEFEERGIKLQFLKPKEFNALNSQSNLVNMSILHMLMYMSVTEVKQLLGLFELV
jgi:hypothetical protein